MKMRLTQILTAAVLASTPSFALADGTATDNTIQYFENAYTGNGIAHITLGDTAVNGNHPLIVTGVGSSVNGGGSSVAVYASDGTGSIDIFGSATNWTNTGYTPKVGDQIQLNNMTYTPYHQIPEVALPSSPDPINSTTIQLIKSNQSIPANHDTYVFTDGSTNSTNTPPSGQSLAAYSQTTTISQITPSTPILLKSSWGNPTPSPDAGVSGYLLTLKNVTIDLNGYPSYFIGNASYNVKDANNKSMTLYYWPTTYSNDVALEGWNVPTKPVDITGTLSVYTNGPTGTIPTKDNSIIEFVPLYISGVGATGPVYTLTSPGTTNKSTKTVTVAWDSNAQWTDVNNNTVPWQDNATTPNTAVIPVTLTPSGVSYANVNLTYSPHVDVLNIQAYGTTVANTGTNNYAIYVQDGITAGKSATINCDLYLPGSPNSHWAISSGATLTLKGAMYTSSTQTSGVDYIFVLGADNTAVLDLSQLQYQDKVNKLNPTQMNGYSIVNGTLRVSADWQLGSTGDIQFSGSGANGNLGGVLKLAGNVTSNTRSYYFAGSGAIDLNGNDFTMTAQNAFASLNTTSTNACTIVDSSAVAAGVSTHKATIENIQKNAINNTYTGFEYGFNVGHTLPSVSSSSSNGVTTTTTTTTFLPGGIVTVGPQMTQTYQIDDNYNVTAVIDTFQPTLVIGGGPVSVMRGTLAIDTYDKRTYTTDGNNTPIGDDKSHTVTVNPDPTWNKSVYGTSTNLSDGAVFQINGNVIWNHDTGYLTNADGTNKLDQNGNVEPGGSGAIQIARDSYTEKTVLVADATGNNTTTTRTYSSANITLLTAGPTSTSTGNGFAAGTLTLLEPLSDMNAGRYTYNFDANHVAQNATLSTIHVKGITGANLAADYAGRVVLAAATKTDTQNNSSYTGAWSVEQGILQVGDPSIGFNSDNQTSLGPNADPNPNGSQNTIHLYHSASDPLNALGTGTVTVGTTKDAGNNTLQGILAIGRTTLDSLGHSTNVGDSGTISPVAPLAALPNAIILNGGILAGTFGDAPAATYAAPLATTGVAASGNITLQSSSTISLADPVNAGYRANFSITGTGNTTWTAGTLTVAPGSVTGGVLTLGRTGGTVQVTSGGLSVSAGTTVNLAGNNMFSDTVTGQSIDLSIANGGNVTVTNPAAIGFGYGVNALKIANGGTFNLGNADLVIKDQANSTNLNSITWAALNPVKDKNGTADLPVAMVQLTGGQIMDAGTTSIDGIKLSRTDLVLHRTLLGDANLDGKISADDYLALDVGYLFGLTGWTHGDFKQTGHITAADYAAIDFAFANQPGSTAAGEITLHTQWFGSAYTDAFTALSIASVPEPTSLSLLALGAAGLLTRRRSAKSSK